MSDAVVAEIRRLEGELAAALVKGDLDALERLYADTLVYAHSGGQIDSKAGWLERLRSDLRIEIYETRDVIVADFGNTAVSMGNTRQASVWKGSRSEIELRFTRVYLKDGGGWRIVAQNSGWGRPS